MRKAYVLLPQFSKGAFVLLIFIQRPTNKTPVIREIKSYDILHADSLSSTIIAAYVTDDSIQAKCITCTHLLNAHFNIK